MAYPEYFKALMTELRFLADNMFRHRLLLGLYSRVAAQLGLERSHVRRVALGLRRSARVEAAIDAEMARIDREIAKRKHQRAAA